MATTTIMPSSRQQICTVSPILRDRRVISCFASVSRSITSSVADRSSLLVGDGRHWFTFDREDLYVHPGGEDRVVGRTLRP